MPARPHSVRRALPSLLLLTLVALGAAGAATAAGRAPAPAAPTGQTSLPDASAPSLTELIRTPASELRPVVERYDEDRGALLRRYDAAYSPARRQRLRELYASWKGRLAELDFDRLSPEGKLDYVLLDNQLRYRSYQLDRDEQFYREMAELLPFAAVISEFQDRRRRMDPVDSRDAAGKLAAVLPQIEAQRQAVEAAVRAGGSKKPSAVVGYRAAAAVEDLRGTLGRWYRYHAGFDPLFTWWNADPFKKADAALVAYGKFLRERVVGIREGQEEPIIGNPIGADGLKADLEVERIPYSAKELVSIAEREYAWCEAELKKASRDMGYGDDWKAALEKVKTLHVDPGKQPELIRKLAEEAIQYVEQRNLVTVPALAKETWRMEMLSPERQKVSPFFLGGEMIQVAYPTEEMAHEDKLMSMRGNNIYFSRATVQHELIPGHHLQQFMTSRYQQHRQLFGTPFWTEGWALYWEMQLWDLGFPKSPEDRMGMLFWRTHRAARILFSLNFHLGRWSPQQCIDFLVDRVGHERANATAEVRRSFGGMYPPLYQAAYMLGGLQFRALYKEQVDSGKMTPRQFHDAILQGGPMPVELVRARLTGAPLTRNQPVAWRFAGLEKE